MEHAMKRVNDLLALAQASAAKVVSSGAAVAKSALEADIGEFKVPALSIELEEEARNALEKQRSALHKELVRFVEDSAFIAALDALGATEKMALEAKLSENK